VANESEMVIGTV